MTGKTIFLVEDNEHDELLILRALRKVDLADSVVVARDGQQALDYLFDAYDAAMRGQGDLPKVVLLDISLPRLSGLEVLERLRADPRTALLPVVMLTSSDDDRDLFMSYKNQANSYVRKPVAFTEFTEVVERIGLYWGRTNTPPREK